MEVVYDISALGVTPRHLQSRTGVFRVVENVAAALLSSARCEVRFCAANCFQELSGALDYVRNDARFSGVPFILPESRGAARAATKLGRGIERINESDGVALPSRVARRVLSDAVRLLEAGCHRFDAGRFPRRGVFHSPFFSLPGRSKLPAALKRFLTVYDLIPILAPQYFGNRTDHFLHGVIASLRPDDWVTCISEATKRDLCAYTGFDPARVFVTRPAAAPELFHRVEDAAALKRAREKYGIPDAPYVLSLNTLEPRKNIEHAVRCFARAAEEGAMRDVCFVLVGPKGWDYGKIIEAARASAAVRGRIILAGFVADEDLAALYSGALAFVYMSFYEGFGLPPLEAMQCGVPVITSNTSSLPEVVGDAGIMLDPHDADGLSQSLLDLCGSLPLRAELSERSLRRASAFSWEKCARETVGAYEAALAG